MLTPALFKGSLGLIKETASRWNNDKAPRLSAALSYYTAFSIAPLLLLTVAIAGLVFGREAVQGQIVSQIDGLVGRDSAEAIQNMMQAASKPSSGIWATIVGVVTLLIGASGVMTELKDALNTIWHAKEESGIKVIIKTRMKAFAMIVAVGFVLLVSLLASAVIAAVGNFLTTLINLPEVVLHVVNAVLSMGIVTLLFALIYKILPDTRIAWRDVWVGSAVTAFLFTLGKFLIGLYLGKAGVATAYGAAGSVLVVLVWVYYSSMILYFGAEFTKVYAERYGSRASKKPLKA